MHYVDWSKILDHCMHVILLFYSISHKELLSLQVLKSLCTSAIVLSAYRLLLYIIRDIGTKSYVFPRDR